MSFFVHQLSVHQRRRHSFLVLTKPAAALCSVSLASVPLTISNRLITLKGPMVYSAFFCDENQLSILKELGCAGTNTSSVALPGQFDQWLVLSLTYSIGSFPAQCPYPVTLERLDWSCLFIKRTFGVETCFAVDSKQLTEEKRTTIFAAFSQHEAHLGFILKVLSPHMISTCMLRRYVFTGTCPLLIALLPLQWQIQSQWHVTR